MILGDGAAVGDKHITASCIECNTVIELIDVSTGAWSRVEIKLTAVKQLNTYGACLSRLTLFPLFDLRILSAKLSKPSRRDSP